MRVLACIIAAALLLVFASVWIARSDSFPPRQRLARSLSSGQIVAAVTNAPTTANVSVPRMFMAASWTNGVAYAVADPVRYKGAIYLCVQAHRSQSDWSPPVVPALWRQIRAAGESADSVPAWVQPTGAHDAYARGDRVTYNGKTWTSTIAANVWAPGVYGWKEVAK